MPLMAIIWMEDGNVGEYENVAMHEWIIPLILSHLIANVELTASRGRARRRQVGQDDGGQHRAPPGLHDHDAEYLAFGLGDDHLLEREDPLGSSFFFIRYPHYCKSLNYCSLNYVVLHINHAVFKNLFKSTA